MKCYLLYQSEYLEDATPCRSVAYACDEFRATADELARYGQRIEATIHRDRETEYPEFVLSLGPRGGLKIERA